MEILDVCPERSRDKNFIWVMLGIYDIMDV